MIIVIADASILDGRIWPGAATAKTLIFASLDQLLFHIEKGLVCTTIVGYLVSHV